MARAGAVLALAKGVERVFKDGIRVMRGRKKRVTSRKECRLKLALGTVETRKPVRRQRHKVEGVMSEKKARTRKALSQTCQ